MTKSDPRAKNQGQMASGSVVRVHTDQRTDAQIASCLVIKKSQFMSQRPGVKGCSSVHIFSKDKRLNILTRGIRIMIIQMNTVRSCKNRPNIFVVVFMFWTAKSFFLRGSGKKLSKRACWVAIRHRPKQRRPGSEKMRPASFFS